MTTTRTDTHEFTIKFFEPYQSFEVNFRPLNAKTGQPWQASHRVEVGADVQPEGWRRPITYSTFELAEAARDRHIAKLARGR